MMIEPPAFEITTFIAAETVVSGLPGQLPPPTKGRSMRYPRYSPERSFVRHVWRLMKLDALTPSTVYEIRPLLGGRSSKNTVPTFLRVTRSGLNDVENVGPVISISAART